MARLGFNRAGVVPISGPASPQDLVSRQRYAPEAVPEAALSETGASGDFGLRWIGTAPLTMPRWLVKGILPESGVALIAGQYAAGKTFVALDLCLAVNLGQPFLGKRTKRGSALWIAAEGAGEVELRIEAARQGKFADAGDLPFTWTADAPPLSSDAGFEWLAGACRVATAESWARFGLPLRLVPIDTLAAAFALEDENDNAEAARIMKRLGDLGRELNLLFAPIAHLGKNSESGVRGASAYGAGADAILGVLANGDPLRGTVSSRALVLSKSRRGGTGPLAKFSLNAVPLGIDEDGEPVASCFVSFDATDATAAAGSEPATSTGRGDIAFREALDEALRHAGREHRVLGNGPPVTAVEMLIVRGCFERRYVTGETEAKKSSALKMAWKRALEKARSDGRIGCENASEGAELIWRL